jgi:tetratricopeptide (TPR) repeat protein
MRYVLLQTLRDYGRGLLAREPGEEAQVLGALAGFALTVAGQAGAGLATSGDARELAALCHLDGEDATLAAALDWALDNAPETALRLAVALAPWWLARGRVGEGYTRLAAAARNRPAADAQLWLGIVAQALGRDPDSEAHNSMAVEMAGDPLSQTAILALAGRSVARRSLGQLAQAAEDTERAVELARQSGGQTARAFALGARAQFEGNVPERLAWSRQAADCLDAEVPGRTARQVRNGLALALTLSGQYDDARRLFAADLAWCREAGDLAGSADLLASRIYLEDVAGDYDAMTVYLHEAVEAMSRPAAALGSATAWAWAATCARRPDVWPRPSRSGPPIWPTLSGPALPKPAATAVARRSCGASRRCWSRTGCGRRGSGAPG